MPFVIAKHAGDTWSLYWGADPKLGVRPNHSVHHTYSGKQVGVQETYSMQELDLAKQHVAELNLLNPVGDYAVCLIK